MGAWGTGPLDNDDARDFIGDLVESDDLSPILQLFEEIEEQAGEYLEAPLASQAIAACEILARLKNPEPPIPDIDDEVAPEDQWLADHPQTVAHGLLVRAAKILDLTLASNSELAQLWDETGDSAWREDTKSLRARLTT